MCSSDLSQVIVFSSSDISLQLQIPANAFNPNDSVPLQVIDSPATILDDPPASIYPPALIDSPASIDQPALINSPALIDQPASIDQPALIDQPASINSPALINSLF